VHLLAPATGFELGSGAALTGSSAARTDVAVNSAAVVTPMKVHFVFIIAPVQMALPSARNAQTSKAKARVERRDRTGKVRQN
jgi:hypothetical protein